MPTDGPPLERLTAGLDAYLEHVRAHGRAFVMLMRGGGGGVDREITDVVDETRSHLLDQLTSGLGMLLPGSDEAVLGSPLLKVALTGWIGLAEAASIAWVEACVDDETSAPSQAEVREVLASALVGIVQSVVTRAAG